MAKGGQAAQHPAAAEVARVTAFFCAFPGGRGPAGSSPGAAGGGPRCRLPGGWFLRVRGAVFSAAGRAAVPRCCRGRCPPPDFALFCRRRGELGGFCPPVAAVLGRARLGGNWMLLSVRERRTAVGRSAGRRAAQRLPVEAAAGIACPVLQGHDSLRRRRGARIPVLVIGTPLRLPYCCIVCTFFPVFSPFRGS